MTFKPFRKNKPVEKPVVHEIDEEDDDDNDSDEDGSTDDEVLMRRIEQERREQRMARWVKIFGLLRFFAYTSVANNYSIHMTNAKY